MFVMAESSCEKDFTKCQDCSCGIKRCKTLKDNSYCDDCEEMRLVGYGEKTKLCNSSRKYFDVKKINILLGLGYNYSKFLFVGEGDFSFTVAFSAYRQSLLSKGSALDMQCSLLNKDYPCSMIAILIVLLQSSITDEAVKQVRELLLKQIRYPLVVSKSVVTGVKYLKEACLELQSAKKYLTLSKSCLAISPLALEHLFRSIQIFNKANEYLLASVQKMDMRILPFSHTEWENEDKKKIDSRA